MKAHGNTKSNILKMIGVIAGMCLVITLVGSIKALHVSDPLILKLRPWTG